MSLTKAGINVLLKNVVKPMLNSGLPEAIRKADLDPWTPVAPGTATLHLGPAKVEATFPIAGVTGLSTLKVEQIEATDVKVSPVKAGPIPVGEKGTATIAITAQITTLTGSVGGKLSGEIFGEHESIDIGGSLTATGVTVSGISGSLTAEVGLLDNEICAGNLSLDDVKFDVQKVSVSIDHLGVFNEILQDLVDKVEEYFGDTIKKELTSAVRSTFNDLLGQQPKKGFCAPLL